VKKHDSVFINNKKTGIPMKNEKGEAAFDSTEDVLAKRIINTTEKHGEKEHTPGLDSTSNYSFDAENHEQSKSGKHRGKAIIIAACVGIVLLIIGIFLFRCKKSCKNWCCRK
jgi:hypothetical protein